MWNGKRDLIKGYGRARDVKGRVKETHRGHVTKETNLPGSLGSHIFQKRCQQQKRGRR